MEFKAECNKVNPIINELSKNDKIIYNGLMMVETGVLTYTQALEQMVIAFSETNRKQHEMLLGLIARHGNSTLE